MRAQTINNASNAALFIYSWDNYGDFRQCSTPCTCVAF
jgi:hypothetical protein